MSDEQTNRVIELAERPQGVPTKNTFRFNDIAVPEPKEKEVLLKSIYVSVDPYMRGRMRDVKSYVEPFAVDEPITGGIVAEVLESNNKAFSAGDIVQGQLEWKKYQTVEPKELQQIDPDLAPTSTALSTLGMTGRTAYFGWLEIGEPEQGETVVVSGAAGAVGSVVAQIAKIKGCRVVGTAGSDEKIDYLENELGVDKAINYKSTDDMMQALAGACPNGVDVYFDNVGGELSDMVLRLINKNARIVLCGQIALYNKNEMPQGPRPQLMLITKSARMEGFIVSDFASKFKIAIKQLATWFNTGEITHRETVTEGFENIPEAFLGLFSGDNIGKQIVKVAEPEN
jgi:NADPH-dependent curcumin reductase CurA